MENLSLFINGGENFRIENGEYFVSVWDGDWDIMKKVTKQEFVDELKKCDWILEGWNKELKNDLGIPRSTLSDLLNVLRDIECVEKIESGRCSFYNLTNDGRKYLREVHPDIDEEWDIDPDSFSMDVREIIRGKEQEGAFVPYLNYKARISFERLDNKWADEAEAYVNV